MIRLLIRWALNAVALLLIAYYINGIEISGFYASAVTIVILGLVNAVIRPILLLLTIPVRLITLGLFTFVINAGLFWFVSTIVEGFTVEGFIPAFLGALGLSVVSAVLGFVIGKKKKK